jgi:transcriptional regulator with XRE-family HTH domain
VYIKRDANGEREGGMAILVAELVALSLRTLRIRAGLTQRELASRAGVTQRTVALLELGRRSRPFPRTRQKIADALGVAIADVQELANGDEPSPPA